jgi:feruloyl esterase
LVYALPHAQSREMLTGVVDTTLYDTFVRYTNYSAAAYASDCPKPPYGASVEKYFNVKKTNTQATLFKDDAKKELILAFRGTTNLQDFIRDLNQSLTPYESIGVKCVGCSVHRGYLTSWNSAADEVVDTLKSVQAANPGYILTVTGHSLGASLAALASVSLVGLGFEFNVYTFGEPRTGNPAWADYVDSILPPGKMFRVTHANDGVPQTITIKDGFKHHSTEYWQADKKKYSAGLTQKCSGQEPPDCNNSEKGTGVGPHAIGINDAHINYSGISVGNPAYQGKHSCR